MLLDKLLAEILLNFMWARILYKFICLRTWESSKATISLLVSIIMDCFDANIQSCCCLSLYCPIVELFATCKLRWRN